MTGGVAFVFDEHGNFQTRCNRELVELVRVAEHESQTVRALIERHSEMTTSLRARQLLSDWERTRNLFWQVVTQAEAARHRDAQLPHVSIAAAFEQAAPLAVAD
jgi:glutamate synthase domain-containing protein 3